jgi:hypothetical protein
MIEILTLAASVTKIAGAISTGIKAGKDVASLMPSVGKLGELDAQIQIAEAGKHKGVLRKLASTEQEAYAISQAKLAHKKAMDELRSHMLLFGGGVGAWDAFQRELSMSRKRKADRLKFEAKKRRDREMMLACAICGISITVGIYAIYLWADYLKGGVNG